LIITILKTCGKFCAGCISLTQLHHTTFYFVFVFKTWQKAVTEEEIHHPKILPTTAAASQ